MSNEHRVIIPDRGALGTIDVNDVRNFIWDRTLDDNPLEMDLMFSDKEITDAMRYCAMKYNEMPPFVNTVMPQNLPFGSTFLSGIAAGLYLSKLQQESRQDVEYTAGSLTVDIQKRRLEHLTNFVKIFKEEFETLAKGIKLTINIHGAFGSY